MRLLFAHTLPGPGWERWYDSLTQPAQDVLELRRFCVTPDPPGPRLGWQQLDTLWRRRDRRLMAMYERLQRAAEGCDVLFLYNGANVHPELLPHLPTFNVYGCHDDPESSAGLSQPVAAAFDAVLYGNIAARFQYESWGCRRLAWLPNLVPPCDVPPREEGEEILARARDVDIALCCERLSPHRSPRLDQLAAAFPQARCHGPGWPGGRIDEADLHDLYRRARIGWNLHNSTGPINRRLFTLCGFGVMQICDNKTGLGQIFELGHEAVGFDTIPEAIELTRYYLDHEEERDAIARAGYERFWRDYHAGALWRRVHQQLETWLAEARTGRAPKPLPRPRPWSRLAAPPARARRALRRVRRMAGAVRREWRAGRGSQPALDDRFYRAVDIEPYLENPELRGFNTAKRRLEEIGLLDWPDVLATNWAVTALIGDAKRIVELGSGTGPFAHFAAVDPSRRIDCFEEDVFAREKAIELRSHPNVRHFARTEGNLVGPYDLLVAVEVIEHVDDLRGFLDLCSQLAPRAIFTTPNRARVRGDAHAGPPPYPPHVREFTPGELLWLLRLHWGRVRLFHLPDPHVPWLAPMTLAERGTPVVAECRDPLEPRLPG